MKLIENKQYKLLYKITNKRLQELEQNKIIDKNLSLNYVEVLSYLNINNFSKVLLDTDIKINDKILALSTIDGYSAGIVIQQDNQTIAYLNNNEKCNYAVFIGSNNIPGITSGTNKKNNLIIKYIPKWNEIKVGDKVYTSGMDNIFPSGLEVGVVLKVETNSNTQTAYIKPSVDVLRKKYFYIIIK
jgi:rod shape-determining protein MreC